MCLGVVLFWLILFATVCAFWTWMSVSFPRLGKFPTIMSSNMFSVLPPTPTPFWDPYNVNVSMLYVVLEVS